MNMQVLTEVILVFQISERIAFFDALLAEQMQFIDHDSSQPQTYTDICGPLTEHVFFAVLLFGSSSTLSALCTIDAFSLVPM